MLSKTWYVVLFAKNSLVGLRTQRKTLKLLVPFKCEEEACHFKLNHPQSLKSI